MKILVLSNPNPPQQEVDPYNKMEKAGVEIDFRGLRGFRDLLRDTREVDYLMNSTSSIKVLLTMYVLSKLTGNEYVVRYTSPTLERIGYQTKNPILRKVKQVTYPLVMKLVFPRAKHVMTCSQYLARQLPVKNSSTIVIYPGVDTDFFSPRDIDEEYDTLYLGRLSSEKGTEHLPEDTTIVYGVPYEELPYHYSRAKVLVLPTKNEGLGMVLLEAQACGTPVIATRVGGTPETMIDGETGYLVDSYSELYERIDYLLSNPKVRRKMGEKGREFVKKNHSLEVVMECLQRI